MSWIEVRFQEGQRECPVAIRRALADAERVGGLFGGQACEITQLDHPDGALVDRGELAQCRIERNRLFGTVECERFVVRGQRDLYPVSAGALTGARARSIKRWRMARAA